MIMSNRIGGVLSKPLLSSRSSASALRVVCGGRLASSTDARNKTYILVIVDNTTGDEQRNNDGFHELLGIDTPAVHRFTNKGRPSLEFQRHLKRVLPPEAELHKLLGSLTAENERNKQQLQLVGVEQKAVDGQQQERSEQQQGAGGEWKVERVDSCRMLLEEVNAMFEKRFPLGRAVTVITLRPEQSATETEQQLLLDEEMENELAEEEAFFKEETKEGEEHGGDSEGSCECEDPETKLEARRRHRAEQRQAEQFVKAADAICAKLQGHGFWSDFIDPRNGRPYLNAKSRMDGGGGEEGEQNGSPGNNGLRRLLQEKDRNKMFCGLRISSTARSGKVIDKAEWKTGDFFGQIFTEAPANSWELQKILLIHGAEFISGTERGEAAEKKEQKREK